MELGLDPLMSAAVEGRLAVGIILHHRMELGLDPLMSAAVEGRL